MRGAGEEIAEARSVLALRLNQKSLTLEVARVFQGRGGQFVLVGVGFETQGVGPQSDIETDTNLVWFALERRITHRGFWEFFRCGLKFFPTSPILPISGECGQITGRTSGSSLHADLGLRVMVTGPHWDTPVTFSNIKN